MIANLQPDWEIGVSTWGQGDEEKLLWVKDHFKNIPKILRHQSKPLIIEETGFTEYYRPALSWTKRFFKGNLDSIIACNELNYLAYKLEHGKPDVLIVQAGYPGALIGKYLSEKYQIPYHVHIRLGGFMFEHLLKDLRGQQAELLSAINQASLISVTSEFQAEGLKRWIPEVKVIHNPVDTDFFIPANISLSEYALSIGRLEPEKGFDRLIDAVSKVDSLQLKIIGDGSQKHDLQKKIEALGLVNRIKLVGKKDRGEIKSFIQGCPFLILPSSYETFGNVILETMACSKPVVSTRCGGPEEIITKETGLLADVNVESLTKQIEKMKNSYMSYDPKVIRNHVLSRFSKDVWLDRLEKMLTDSLRK